MDNAGLAGMKHIGTENEREPRPSISERADRLAMWVERHSDWLAIVTITIAAALSLYMASSCYLNPDEGQHFNAARSDTRRGAFEQSLRVTHPPLLILVLHAFLFLGRSEVILRLPSLLAGTAALWLTFAWIRRMLGVVPALTGLLLMAASRASISASTEVRQYGLLLFFICGALYATERVLAERSVRWSIIQGLFMLGAVLSHFVAPIAIVSIDVYVLSRCLFFDRIPRRILLLLGVMQLVVAGTFAGLAFLEFRHIQTLHLDYLALYFPGGGETLFRFFRRALFATFSYMLSSKLAHLAMLIFLAGLLALAMGRTKAPRATALLLASPFAFGFLAAVVHKLPFGGSRHQIYLLPFLAAGVAAAINWVPRRLAAPLLLLAIGPAFVWATHNPPDNDPHRMPIGDMAAALIYAAQAPPAGAPFFVDDESHYVLNYYIWRNNLNADWPRSGVSNDPALGSHRLISSKEYIWYFDPKYVFSQWCTTARLRNLPRSDHLWMFSVAWLETPLAQRLDAKRIISAKEFGSISVIETVCP